MENYINSKQRVEIETLMASIDSATVIDANSHKGLLVFPS